MKWAREHVANRELVKNVGQAYRQQRDTGHRNVGGQALFQDINTQHLYWASKIKGHDSNWTWTQTHEPRCNGFDPTPFSTGRMQRCSCPIEFKGLGVSPTLTYP